MSATTPAQRGQEIGTSANSSKTKQWAMQRKLIGWYSYAWACEPFIVSAVGTYVPLLLEQYARYNGVWIGDRLTKCLDVAPTLYNSNEKQRSIYMYSPPPSTPPPGTPIPGDPGQTVKCEVKFFGHWVDTSSLPLYTFSLSVLVQTIVVISMSGAADRGHYRKKLLVGFAVFGAVCTCCFLVTGPSHYYVACFLAIMSNAAFGAVSVCGNAFLPILASQVAHNKLEDDDNCCDASETQPLLTGATADSTELDGTKPLTIDTATSSAMATISGRGVAIGYSGALLVQLATMFLLVALGRGKSPDKTNDGSISIRIAVFAVGIWWLVFQIPVQIFLEGSHHRSISTTEPESSSKLLRKLRSTWNLVWFGWNTIGQAIKQARYMRDVCGFLIGWFIVSDALTTINSAAILFARVELQMSAPQLAIIGVLVVISGIFGAMVVPKVRLTKEKQSPVECVIFVILVASVIPLYGMLGFFIDNIGLKRGWEMYMLGIWYGFALGGLNASCRYVYSLLIPRGSEATFFSLFAVTDKGSSIIGPIISGMITDRTHNIRYTFYFLFGMMVLACISFTGLVDVDRGIQEARELQQVVNQGPGSATVESTEVHE